MERLETRLERIRVTARFTYAFHAREVRFELDRGGLAGFAGAIVPTHFASGQEWKLPIGGSGLEHVTGEVT